MVAQTLTAVYLDLSATIVPAFSLWILKLRKTSIFGAKAGNILRLNIYFLAAVGFDSLRNLGLDWALYGMLVSLWLIFEELGLLAATLHFCPESRSLKESLTKVTHHLSFRIYGVITIVWLIVNLTLPEWYLTSTLALLATVIAYPTGLFSLAIGKTQSQKTKEMLTVLMVSWVFFVTLAMILLALGTEPPVLGVSLPFAWQIAFVTSSSFFFFMTKAMTDPTGPARPWMGFLTTNPILKPGNRYLLVHDTGEKAIAFLKSCLENLVETGGKIIMKTTGENSFLDGLARNDRSFSTWMREGKLLLNPSELSTREKLSERLHPSLGTNVHVTELERSSLGEASPQYNRGVESDHASELFLLESTKARPFQLTEFLRRNRDLQLLDLSEPKAPFSHLTNLDHSQLQGRTILLEYDSEASYEDIVDSFLTESVANAEISVFFTAKSSKLYRAIKGKNLVNIAAASSLVSSPTELPDGEIEIPDKELGLVTSIASDFLDGNKNNTVSFVFDSITELIRGDRWEQVYSGVKQLVELLSLPNATTLFLANRDTLDPRFLGALRGIFSVQLKLDKTGLQLTKLTKT